MKGQNRLDPRKYSFPRSNSVEMFKNRIDNYLVRQDRPTLRFVHVES